MSAVDHVTFVCGSVCHFCSILYENKKKKNLEEGLTAEKGAVRIDCSAKRTGGKMREMYYLDTMCQH